VLASEAANVIRNVDGEENRFRLDDLEAGSYRLAVKPGGDWWEARGYFAQAESVVGIPEAGRFEIEIAILAGGRLRVAACAPDGRFLPARCRVLDERGEPLDVRFVARFDGGGRASSRTTLIGNGANDVDPALPPGRYAVELSHEGYTTDDRMVEVFAGRTTNLEVTLARE
jgi:hypothetical protein